MGAEGCVWWKLLHLGQIILQIDQVDPNPPFSYAVQDLCSTDPTQEICPGDHAACTAPTRLNELHGS